MKNLEIRIGKLHLQNPVIIASGVIGYGIEYADLINFDKLGAITLKTITLKPKKGNSPGRIVEVASGIINYIGLENVGLEKFLLEKLPQLRQRTKTKIIVSISGENIAEFVTLTRRLSSVKDIAAIELNISCPNTEGKIIAQNKIKTYNTVKAVRQVTHLPLIAKLSPNVTDIVEIAQVCREAGVTAVTLVNSLYAAAFDKNNKLLFGGLSGPAIKPIALRIVYEVSHKTEIPVIAAGGITTTQDAIHFLHCGAKAVSIGCAIFRDPQIPVRIATELKNYRTKSI